MPVDFFDAGDAGDLPRGRLATYRVIFILNQSAGEAARVAERLAELHKEDREIHVVALDQRDTQAALRKGGLLEEPEEVRRYWRYGGATNFRRLLIYAAATYLGEDRQVLPAVVVPEDGFYHPDAPRLFGKVDEYWAWYAKRHGPDIHEPRVVMVAHQSFIILGDTEVVDAVIRQFERIHVPIAVVFASNEQIARPLITGSHPALLLSQRHSALGRMTEGEAYLPAHLNTPYLEPISMIGQTIERWREDPRGLSPTDIGTQVVVQEADGVIEPVVIGGLVEQESGFRAHEPIPDRIEQLAARAKSWLTLRAKPNADKHVAIIYYDRRGSSRGCREPL